MKPEIKKAPDLNSDRNHFNAEPSAKCRVIILDENVLCRRGLRDLLHEDGRFEVIAEADDVEVGVRLILELLPDVVVLDSTLQTSATLGLATRLKRLRSTTGLVLLIVEPDENMFNQAINFGIRGHVLKKQTAAEILACITAVAKGDSYVSPFLTDVLLRRRNRVEALIRRPALARLTPMERRVLKRIAQGITSAEIANENGISVRTVDTHRAHICKKLGITGNNRLLHFALEHRDALSHLE